MEGTVFFDAGQPPFPKSDPVVVKIGGSLTRQPERLLPVLEILEHARRRLAVVAGGGAYADEVRKSQLRYGFSDLAAHRMAILAMHQNAFAMASLAASLVPQERTVDIRSGLTSGRKAIWLPLHECQNDSDLPQTWAATSDAIAVRLAERLGGLPVVFVKSRGPRIKSCDPAGLAADNLIDPVSARLLLRSHLPFSIVDAGHLSPLASLLAARESVDAAPGA